MGVSVKPAPCAPMKVRSTQAVNRPAEAPSTNHGTSGLTSRRQSRRPRCHQKMTSKAAGRVAVTVLLSRASTNRPSAQK